MNRVAVVGMFLLIGCVPPEGGGGGGGGNNSNLPPIPDGPPSESEMQLNALLRGHHDEGEPSGEPNVDPAIEVSSAAGGEANDGTSRTRHTTSDGQSVRVGIGYRSTSPVDAVCIGFGSPDQAWCIPASSDRVERTGDDTEGALAVELEFPPELCAMLGTICHDIRCYEFARTSDGTFSRSNINMLAYACGSCDEPSCRSLIADCSGAPQGGAGCSPNCQQRECGDDGCGGTCGSCDRGFFCCGGREAERGECEGGSCVRTCEFVAPDLTAGSCCDDDDDCETNSPLTYVCDGGICK